jgi:hypothetical protein
MSVSARANGIIIYVPDVILQRAVSRVDNGVKKPPTREEAIEFLRKAVCYEDLKPQGPLQSKKVLYRMTDSPSMMRAVTSFYGVYASSRNAMERTAIVSEVCQELENTRRTAGVIEKAGHRQRVKNLRGKA